MHRLLGAEVDTYIKKIQIRTNKNQEAVRLFLCLTGALERREDKHGTVILPYVLVAYCLDASKGYRFSLTFKLCHLIAEHPRFGVVKKERIDTLYMAYLQKLEDRMPLYPFSTKVMIMSAL